MYSRKEEKQPVGVLEAGPLEQTVDDPSLFPRISRKRLVEGLRGAHYRVGMNPDKYFVGNCE